MARRCENQARSPSRGGPGADVEPNAPTPRPGRYILFLSVIAVGLLILPHLPRGTCFDDSGDLQATCRELGVAHAPGYVGYVTVGWLLTRIPGLDSAFTITLACCVSGLLALGLSGRLQVRLGAHPLAAGTVVLLSTLHPAVRDNLVVPEIYAPTAALLAGALALVYAYRQTGRLRFAGGVGLVLGILVSSRTPAVLMIPGFVVGLWVACRARGLTRGTAARTLVTAALWAAGPCLYTAGYLWRREPPDSVAYSAVLAGNQQSGVAASDARARADDIVRCLTGANYKVRWSTSWAAARTRAGWVLRNSLPEGTHWCLVLIVPLCAMGFLRIARRAPEVAWSLAGICVGAGGLLVLVHTDGTAADYLPLVVALGVCGGVGLSGSEAPTTRGQLFAIRYLVFLVAAIAAGRGLLQKPNVANVIDASPFLAGLEVATLPADALIFAQYFEATALRCARQDSRRNDIQVLRADSEQAHRLLDRFSRDRERCDRVLLATPDVDPPPGWQMLPYRNIRRLQYAP